MRGRSLRIAVIGAAIAILAIVAPAPRVGAAPASGVHRDVGRHGDRRLHHFGGDIERGCAPGSPRTALAALHAAGFATAGTAQYGDAFLCRIDGLPSPEDGGVHATRRPRSRRGRSTTRGPTDAAWTYSSVGVLSYQPPPGTIIAFAFGNHAKPGVLPVGARSSPRPRRRPPRPRRRPPPHDHDRDPSATRSVAPRRRDRHADGRRDHGADRRRRRRRRPRRRPRPPAPARRRDASTSTTTAPRDRRPDRGRPRRRAARARARPCPRSSPSRWSSALGAGARASTIRARRRRTA